jgi:hypothetical protein
MAAIRLAGNRVRSIGSTCALALALAACSTVQDFAGLDHPGYQKDGSYVLSSQEQDLGCRALEERSKGLQGQMQELSQRAVQEMQQLPQTVSNAWGRLVGSPGEGIPAVAEYNEARAESAALSATIARKGCNSPETASIKQ